MRPPEKTNTLSHMAAISARSVEASTCTTPKRHRTHLCHVLPNRRVKRPPNATTITWNECHPCSTTAR